MNRSLVLCIALLGISMMGCYSTTIRSGRAVEPQPARLAGSIHAKDFDERWHHGFVNGVAEVDGGYNLNQICSQGWGEIQVKESFLNGVVRYASMGLYAPQSITIKCAKPAPGAASAASPAPLPSAAPAYEGGDVARKGGVETRF